MSVKTSSISMFLRSVKRPQVYGMIHLPALPGSPLASMNITAISKNVRKEAELYAKCGVDGIVLENMHDIPYQLSSDVGPEVVACMSRVCLEVKQLLGKERNQFKCGVQILAGANKQAVAVAQAAEFDFIRAEGFVFSHIADEGLINACAGNLLRYRRQIGAEEIAIFADIKKKHSSHSITADVSTLETANAASFFLADGVILTGTSTGEAASESELKEDHGFFELRNKCSFPILIGSGITLKNAKSYKRANAFIIGSYLKAGGLWYNELDHFKIKEFMNFVKNDFV